MTRTRRILHASDFSPASRAAFGKALALARADRAELVVAHVLSPVAPLIGEGYVSPKVFAQLQRSVQAEARKGLDRLLARARKARVRATGVLLEWIPHEAIGRAARARRADLIVVGTHGRSGLGKLFQGSVAERVVATAPCPVLTVRGR